MLALGASWRIPFINCINLAVLISAILLSAEPIVAEPAQRPQRRWLAQCQISSSPSPCA